MKTPQNSTHHEEVLRRHYRWMRAGLPLTILSVGLFVTLAGIWLSRIFNRPGWVNWIWGVGLGASGLLGLGLWLMRRWSLRERAQRVDERLQSLNRLETAAQFAKIDDPLLRAQREETAAFLKQTPAHKHPARIPWLVLAACLILLCHAITWLAWVRPWASQPNTAAAAPKPAAATPATLPQASIRWVTPKPESNAAPIEEVPLEATADSTSGLRDLSLEISVNGQPKLAVPVSLPELASAGPHKIETSIYMDQLGVQPYDMVSYYLRAQRVTGQKSPETVSPMQFVEVKPFREDIREEGGQQGQQGQQQGQTQAEQNAQNALHSATAIKVAQLRLMTENFTLAHAEISHDQPEWQQENQRVAGEQGTLQTKTGDVMQLMIQNSSPAEIVDLVSQAKPLMGDAAKKITAEQNDPALPVQGKALADITEIEKYLVKVVGQQGQNASNARQNQGQQQARVADPFEKQRDVQLKQRAQTEAGTLETLAREQSRLAADLDNGVTGSDAPPPGTAPDKNRITGTPAERQTQISQQVGALLNGNNFDSDTTGHLEKGREHAQESLRQLDAEDPQEAREPASAAAQELQAAADAMNRAGQQQAQQQETAALHAMNQAADQARNTPNQPTQQQSRDAAQRTAQQVEQTRQNLANEAERQQADGSEKAAAQMAALANALNDPKLRQQLQQLRDQSRDPATAKATADHLDQLAQRLAPQTAPGAPTREQLADLADRLERARTNLQRLAQLSGAPQLPSVPGKPQTVPQPGAQPGQQQPGQQPGQPGQPNQPGQQGQQPQPGQGRQPNSQPPQPGQLGQNGQPNQPGQGKPDQNGQRGDRGQGQQGQNGQRPPDGQPGQQGQTAQGGGDRGQQGQRPANAPAPGAERTAGAPGNADGPDTAGSRPAAESPSTATQAARQEFAQNLVDQVVEESNDVTTALPNTPLIMNAQQQVRRAVTVLQDGPTSAYVLAYGQLNEPISTMLAALHDQLQRTARKTELTDQNVEQAPPAYRDVVADYFERLSRDYQTAPADKTQ